MATAAPVPAETKFWVVRGIGLPVGVGHKADRGVECQLPAQTRQLLRVEGQQPLRHQDQEQQTETGAVEGQQAEGVGLPVLLPPIGATASQCGALDWCQPADFAFKYPVDVVAQQRCRQQNQQHEGHRIDYFLPHVLVPHSWSRCVRARIGLLTRLGSLLATG